MFVFLIYISIWFYYFPLSYFLSYVKSWSANNSAISLIIDSHVSYPFTFRNCAYESERETFFKAYHFTQRNYKYETYAGLVQAIGTYFKHRRRDTKQVLSLPGPLPLSPSSMCSYDLRDTMRHLLWRQSRLLFRGEEKRKLNFSLPLFQSCLCEWRQEYLIILQLSNLRRQYLSALKHDHR